MYYLFRDNDQISSRQFCININLIYLSWGTDHIILTMDPQYQKNLKYCEKLKENECFIEADGLQKKIRKMEGSRKDVLCDAEMTMREIFCFWKVGWEYDHTHQVYLEPKITKPKVYIQSPSSQTLEPGLGSYYLLMKRFISKLKIQHEDETNFKMELNQYPQNSVSVNDENNLSVADYALNHLLNVFGEISKKMIINLNKSNEQLANSMMDQDANQQVHLQFIAKVCQAMLKTQNHMDQEFYNKRLITLQFMSFMSRRMFEAKQTKVYSSLVTVQPFIGELTYIIHPILLSIYSHFSHEILIKNAKKKMGKRYADEEEQKLVFDWSLINFNHQKMQLRQIEDNFRIEEYRHSKILFLNLDGYESQYNLEFARNFPDHLMYVSFPKFDKNAGDERYNKRFYKKIMFNFTKQQIELINYGDQNFRQTLLREQLTENPEKYQQTINQMYAPQKDEVEMDDLNRSIYVYPLNFKEHDKIQQTNDDHNIESYQSHFVRFLLRDHVYSEMRNFRPTVIVISYSGRIVLENDHFLEMMQQLHKICPRTIMFPNFTTNLIKKKMDQYYDNFPNVPAYDKIFDIGRHIIDSENQNNAMGIQRYFNNLNACETELMFKLAIFLKVSGGHYNTSLPFEEEDLQSRIKNSRTYKYLIYLFNILQNEYDHCKKQLQINSLESYRNLVVKTIKQHKKQLSKCITPYHHALFQQIQQLLNGSPSSMSNDYKEEINYWKDKSGNIHDWYRFREDQEVALASETHHETSYIQIRRQSAKAEFNQVINQQKMDNLDDVYKIQFNYKQSNEVVKITKDVALLYKQNQCSAQKNQFYIVLTNVYSPDKHRIHHYLAKTKLAKRKLQRCQVQPIVFKTRNGSKDSQIFKVWTEWSFAETTHHLVLYWPKQFDYVAYYLNKLLKRYYEPAIRSDMYVSTKNQKNEEIFYEVVLQGDAFLPRWGCTAFSLGDQIFIFGGFHDRQNSYLELQNQISTLDLTDFEPRDFGARKLFNLQKQLYNGQAFLGRLREGQNVNSYVRPRMNFQFYEEQQLRDYSQQEKQQIENERAVYIVMIGGYGQDFKTPHSLFVNFYYLLKFDRDTRRLKSIKKKIIQGKVVPINVRAMIRNRGIFRKANIVDQSQNNDSQVRRCKEGIANNRHYFFHRIAYSIINGQLQAKIKSLAALELYYNCKKDFQIVGPSLGETYMIENQPEEVHIRKLQGNNHQILVDIDNSFHRFSLFLNMRSAEQIDQIPLTNEAIISIDTKNLTIFALINHFQYTNNKAILAVETLIKNENQLSLTLKKMFPFSQNFKLHALIACNTNEVALLHGIGYEGSKARDYLIKVKSQNETEAIKETASPINVSCSLFQSITTFFFKKRHLINSFNFMVHQDDPYCFSLVKLQLNILKFSNGWKELWRCDKVRLLSKGNVEAIQKIKMDIKLDNYDNSEQLYLVVSSRNGLQYSKISTIDATVTIIQLSQIKAEEKQRFKNMDTLNKVIKSIQLYNDSDYFND